MRFILTLLLSLWLVSCKATTTSSESRIENTEIATDELMTGVNDVSAIHTFKPGEPGTITLKGRLIVSDPQNFLPAPNDAIFLVPLPSEQGVVSIPQFEIGEVPQAEVDEQTGDFQFINVQPGKYVVVVLTNDDAQIPARFLESSNLAFVSVAEADRDQIVQLEYLSFP